MKYLNVNMTGRVLLSADTAPLENTRLKMIGSRKLAAGCLDTSTCSLDTMCTSIQWLDWSHSSASTGCRYTLVYTCQCVPLGWASPSVRRVAVHQSARPLHPLCCVTWCILFVIVSFVDARSCLYTVHCSSCSCLAWPPYTPRFLLVPLPPVSEYMCLCVTYSPEFNAGQMFPDGRRRSTSSTLDDHAAAAAAAAALAWQRRAWPSGWIIQSRSSYTVACRIIGRTVRIESKLVAGVLCIIIARWRIVQTHGVWRGLEVIQYWPLQPEMT